MGVLKLWNGSDWVSAGLGGSGGIAGEDGDVVQYQSLLFAKDERNLTLTYSGDKISTIVEKDGATTVKTTTVTYTGDKVTQVVEVADGATLTMAYTYTGDNLTSRTKVLT
jgi:hypothetical protein